MIQHDESVRGKSRRKPLGQADPSSPGGERRRRQNEWEEREADRIGALKLTLAFLIPAIALVIWAAFFMG